MSVGGVGSVSGSIVTPTPSGGAAGDSPGGGSSVSQGSGGGSGPASVVSLSGGTPTSCASGGLSTEGFLGLQKAGGSQDPLMESIKKIMEIMLAVKLLEALSKPQ